MRVSPRHSGLLVTPDQYYANIHTTEFPGGAARGQLIPALGRVLMGVMTSENEVPAPPVHIALIYCYR